MSAKPEVLSGEPSAQLIEKIDQMFEQLYREAGTSAHALLSTSHSDAEAAEVTRGAIIVGNSTPAWAKLTPTVAATYPRYDGADTSWAAIVETDITNGTLLARVADNETISGTYKFTTAPAVANSIAWSARNAADTLTIPLLRSSGTTLTLGDGASAAHNFISFSLNSASRLTLFSSGSNHQFYGTSNNQIALGVNGQQWASFHCNDAYFYESFRWSGLISPSALSAGNNNNYNPTSLAASTYLRLTGNATTSVLTGIAVTGTAVDDNGRYLILKNIGTPSINVTNEDTNSTAGNRILTCTGRTRVLETGATLCLLYDATASRWVEIGGGSSVDETLTVVKTADENVNNSATLQDDDHLLVTVVAGATYDFDIYIFGTQANATPGLKVGLAGTATATSIKYQVEVWDDTAAAYAANARATALGGSVTAATMGANDFHVRIRGSIVVNAAGTLRVQWAQNTATVANTTFQQHSSMLVKRIVP